MPKKDTLYYELIDACAETGCPLCRLSLVSVRRYMASGMFEFVNDIESRADLRAARGYCNDHAWWLTETRGNSLGIAIIHHDVVNALLRVIDGLSTGRRGRQRAQELLNRLNPSRECPACAYRRSMEDVMIGALLKHIKDEGLVELLVGCGGLCLVHFSRALELVRNDRTLTQLVAVQRRTMGELRDELAEFIRKNDYRFQHEGFGKEGDSWRRAVAIVCADQDVR